MPRGLIKRPIADSEQAAEFVAYLDGKGRGATIYRWAARRFFTDWPDPGAWTELPLEARLGGHTALKAVVNWLMLTGRLQPGYDYLLARGCLRGAWADLPDTPWWPGVERFQQTAVRIGYTGWTARHAASEVLMRLVLQTGRLVHELTSKDVDEFERAVHEREERTGKRCAHYRKLLPTTRAVLYHMGVIDEEPLNPHTLRRRSYEQRLAHLPAGLARRFLDYLEAISGTHQPSTISATCRRLQLFGEHLAAARPPATTLGGIERRHVESYLASVARARRSTDGAPLSQSERKQRVTAVHSFLSNISDWDWPDAPARPLVFARDIPKEGRLLPRYLPPEADRRLVEALERSPNRLFADALLVARAAGLRIGELLMLELDCVHEVPDLGAWLKVPLGKMQTERMVPLDEETVATVDRIVASRGTQRPLRDRRTGRTVEFLLVRYGKRVSASALRNELIRAGAAAGIGHVTPHQLRHTFATAMINAGVSLQSLMAMLGHVTAEMSLRYARVFDQTIRADYERALALAKERLGPVMPGTPVTHDGDWRELPLIKARLAGGYCLRTAAQGVCPYTNVCEHCPNFRTDAAFLPILAAQKRDAEVLTRDAEQRGWGTEAARHRRLVERLDSMITRASAVS